jgi:hypothetical protein
MDKENKMKLIKKLEENDPTSYQNYIKGNNIS